MLKCTDDKAEQAPGLCSGLQWSNCPFKFSLHCCWRVAAARSQCLTPAGGGTVSSVHTYCFFCACEARSLAFSLAASAVSLARSVAVSAKVRDGVSPAIKPTRWVQYLLKILGKTLRRCLDNFCPTNVTLASGRFLLLTLPHLTLHLGQDELKPFHGLRYAALKSRKAEFLEKDKEDPKYYYIFFLMQFQKLAIITFANI